MNFNKITTSCLNHAIVLAWSNGFSQLLSLELLYDAK